MRSKNSKTNAVPFVFILHFEFTNLGLNVTPRTDAFFVKAFGLELRHFVKALEFIDKLFFQSTSITT